MLSLVDDRSDERLRLGRVTDHHRPGEVDQLIFQLGPQAPRSVETRGGRAVLPLVLVRAADGSGRELFDVGARVCQDEVLAAGLADESWVVAVLRNVLADRPPDVLER